MPGQELRRGGGGDTGSGSTHKVQRLTWQEGLLGSAWQQSDLRLRMGVAGSEARQRPQRGQGQAVRSGSTRQGCGEAGSEESLKAGGSARGGDCDGDRRGDRGAEGSVLCRDPRGKSRPWVWR